jgi:hypothetical protein
MRKAIKDGLEKGLSEFESLKNVGVFIDPVERFIKVEGLAENLSNTLS